MSKTKEIWAPVPGLADLYEVSDQGRVRAVSRKVTIRTKDGRWSDRVLPTKVLRQAVNRRGHRRVMLGWVTGGWRQKRHAYVHSLVLAAFRGPRTEGLLVCHRNDRKNDNRLSNLYYGTRKDNAQDALRNGCHGTERKRRSNA